MSRKLNAQEIKLHKAIYKLPNQTATGSDVAAIISDPTQRQEALNFLLSTGWIKLLKDAKGALLYQGVALKEMEAKKDLSKDETIVYNQISAAGNEGIWTKHLKAKTDLHQTVIDRCIKSLTQKQLIKSTKSVEHPTRKIFMRADLEPSVKMTGGPWYTDSELDTEFIKLLTGACLHFVRERSFPKNTGSDTLYPLSSLPKYPSAADVQSRLSKSRITETSLSTEHVEQLLHVLVLDGEIEKIPAFGAAVWESANLLDAPSDEEEEEDAIERVKKYKSRSKKKKRRHDSSSDEDSESSAKRMKKKKSRKEDSSEDENTDDESVKEKKKKKKKKQDRDSDSDSDDKSSKRKKKSKRSKSESESEDSDSDSEDDRKKRKKRKKSKADTDSSTESDTPRKQKRKKRPAKVEWRSPSPGLYDGTQGASAYVYRALRPGADRMTLGWSQAPCVRCPVFDFCKEGGPVSPSGCEYYGSWLENGVVADF